MAIQLDTSQPINRVAIHGTLADDATGNLTGRFTSLFTQEVYTTTFTGVQEGDFVIAEIPAAAVPPETGDYLLNITESEATFLSLSEITLSLNQITESLLNIRGTSFEENFTETLAKVIGTDRIPIVSQVARPSDISEPTARSTAFNEPTARSTTFIQKTARSIPQTN